LEGVACPHGGAHKGRVFARIASIAALSIVATSLLGCEPRRPKESEETIRLVQAALPGMTERCVERIRYDGLDTMPHRVDRCFEMAPARRWRGLWADVFEGQQFCPEPMRTCFFEENRPRIWLSFASGTFPTGDGMSGRIYRIEFIGRRTLRPGHYGHLGVFQHEIVVDRVIAVSPADTH
jgi:hypothetical protein